MSWFKAADVKPSEGERVLVHDDVRVVAGRHVGGRRRVEELSDGRLTGMARATHRTPLLDSEDYVPADG